MVFNKLVSFLYNFISLRGQPRIKDATSYKMITLDILENAKKGALNSPAGSSSTNALEVEGELCCVCLSHLEVGENMCILPCLHKFHKACVERWFNVCRKTCPVCRFSMDEEEKYKKEEQLTEEMVIWFSSFHVAGF